VTKKTRNSHAFAQKKASVERLRKTPIGKALREAYQDVLNEPLPDQLTDLLNQIRESEKR